MQDEPEKPRSDMKWGVPASILVHLVLAAILILGLPIELPQPPEEDEAVSVEIVEPPPEPEPPEPEPSEAEEPEPPAAEPEQAPPEPEPEPVPEPEPAAEEEPAEPAPVPEPPPAPEPQPEPQPQADAPQDDAANAAPTPVLRRVYEFGEETTGPEVSTDGDATAEAREPAETTEEPIEEPVEPGAPDVLAAAGSDAEPDAALAEAAPPETVEDAPEADAPAAETPLVALTEATTLFSEEMTNDPVAQTAMGDIPRGLRATQLCETELTEQLRNASPSRDPDFIPRSPLSDGNTLELRQTAFRSQGQWYDLSFRCEINADATRVTGFAFDIGAPVPRSEWRDRGFPGF